MSVILVTKLVCVLNVILRTWAYNIDVSHPVIYKNPDAASGSYFGYSVVLYRDNKTKEAWVKIGAPGGTYTFTNKTSLHRSGLLYYCPFLDNCQLDESINYEALTNNSWLGGSMDISYSNKMLAVSAWKRATYGYAADGGVFFEDLESDRFQNSTYYMPLDTKSYGMVQQKAYYTNSLSGFSVHFPQGDPHVVIGCPGVYDFRGTIYRVTNINNTQSSWTHQVIDPEQFKNEDQYAGYAITSGRFLQKKEIHYAIGTPRGYMTESTVSRDRFKFANTGKVHIIKFSESTDPTSNFLFKPSNDKAHQVGGINIATIYGQREVGANFGYSLTAGDLNGDGFDDLVVGAPRSKISQDGFDRGAVHIFKGQDISSDNPTAYRIVGPVSEGQFGLAVMFLGDLDHDKHAELAISAPMEQGCGAVYIYTNDYRRRFNFTMTQKILGKDVYSGLRGFGWTISRPTDIDHNGYADFAVGSVLSEHVVVLRSKSVIQISIHKFQKTYPTRENPSFLVWYCYEFDKKFVGKFRIKRVLEIDSDLKRFYFEGSEQNHIEEKLIDANNSEICENITFVKHNLSHDYVKPITMILTYEIFEDPERAHRNPVVISENNAYSDTFCKSCPILSKNNRLSIAENKIRIKKTISWQNKCIHNDVKENCRSQLNVTAKLLNVKEYNTLVLGSKVAAFLNVTVINDGDFAVPIILKVDLPNGVVVDGGPKECNIDERAISCFTNYGLNKTQGLTYNFSVTINPENPAGDLEFTFTVFNDTEHVSFDSKFNLVAKCIREVDLAISGYSTESNFIYNRENPKPVNIQNVYQISKLGPSPALSTEVNFLVPYKMKNADGMLTQIANVSPTKENPDLHCTILENWIIDTKVTAQIRKFTELGFSKVAHLDCTADNIVCASVKCNLSASQINKQNAPRITIDIVADFLNFDDWLQEVDQIVLSTHAFIVTTEFNQTGNEPDFIDLYNVITVQQAEEISWWIIVVSAIIGFAILVFISIVLGKSGFFERKKHDLVQKAMQDNIDAEELKELEEMIQKEYEPTGDPLQKCFDTNSPEEINKYFMHLETASRQPLLISEETINDIYLRSEASC